MLSKEDIISINKEFDKGIVVNNSSMEFAISHIEHSKNWLSQCAYLTRAILIDHIFEEGNKRTAAAVILTYFEIHKIAYDPYKVDKIIVEIITKNINDINKIKRMMKDAIR
ncbi:hypothetical protein J4434_03365 [Candidatus Woesearchaeota archaeon]|nr:hypothetical protein [Candidatus Woesearchaeota archaeon]